MGVRLRGACWSLDCLFGDGGDGWVGVAVLEGIRGRGVMGDGW